MSTTSRNTNQQVITTRDLDEVSTFLLREGVSAVRKNPIKVSAYLIGLIICVFFNGFKVTDTQRNQFQKAVESIDHDSMYEASAEYDRSYRLYAANKGWFSCNSVCQIYKMDMESKLKRLNSLRADEDRKISTAKSSLGIFSEYGVEETRNLFWERFAQGKGFATRQSKWDAIFMGIGAMGRDESMLAYIFRLILSVLFNFTLGVCGAVFAFIFSLFTLLRAYNVSAITGIVYFLLASLAAIAFAMTWLIGLYLGTAGTVFVGAKLLASNVRIEDINRGERRHRVN
eukprot:gene12024-16095_t